MTDEIRLNKNMIQKKYYILLHCPICLSNLNKIKKKEKKKEASLVTKCPTQRKCFQNMIKTKKNKKKIEKNAKHNEQTKQAI